MSEVALNSALERQKWINNYFAEYVRGSRFAPYMGRSATSIIFAKYELQEEAGKTINMPLITRLKGDGVTGSAALDGSEEQLGNYNCTISVDWRRNGVRVPKSTQYKTEIDLLNAAKDMLKQWEAEKLRDDIIIAMLSVTTGTPGGAGNQDQTVALSASTAGNRNTYALNNSDRLLFGQLKSNYSATFATAMGNVDTTNDKCTVPTMGLAKRMAKSSDPHIRPYQVDDTKGQEFFVAFHGARTFRDLSADATMTQANRDARAREGAGMDKNPIFQDGDLLYQGAIHREIPEIDDVCTASGQMDAAGNGACDVRPVFLCGQQAVGVAWGQEPTPKTDYVKDYGFRPGVAIEELLGVKKAAFNGHQHGMVTVFCAAAADS